MGGRVPFPRFFFYLTLPEASFLIMIHLSSPQFLKERKGI